MFEPKRNTCGISSLPSVAPVFLGEIFYGLRTVSPPAGFEAATVFGARWKRFFDFAEI